MALACARIRGWPARCLSALGNAGICNIQMITTSEIKISVVIDEQVLEQGVRAVHDGFELDKACHQNVSSPLLK